MNRLNGAEAGTRDRDRDRGQGVGTSNKGTHVEFSSLLSKQKADVRTDYRLQTKTGTETASSKRQLVNGTGESREF